MKWWKSLLRVLLILFAVVMVAVAVAGFFLPSTLEVEESLVIQAPPAVVYERAASLKRWAEWAPWWEREPFLETAFSGPDSGKGALMKWSSRSQGAGQVKITGALPEREILLALDFGERGEASSALILTPEGADAVSVRWKFEAEFRDNTGRRWFGLLMRNYLRRELSSALLALKAASEESLASKPATSSP